MYIHFFGEQSLTYSAANTFFLLLYLSTVSLLYYFIVTLSFLSFLALMRKPCCFIPFRSVAFPFLLSHPLTQLPSKHVGAPVWSLNSLLRGVACFTLLLWMAQTKNTVTL